MDAETSKLLVGAVAVLWGSLVGAVTYIRHLFGERDRLREATIADLNRRIEKMEDREEERNRASERYLENLERAVDLLSRTTDVTEGVIRGGPAGRRPRGGD